MRGRYKDMPKELKELRSLLPKDFYKMHPIFLGFFVRILIHGPTEYLNFCRDCFTTLYCSKTAYRLSCLKNKYTLPKHFVVIENI